LLYSQQGANYFQKGEYQKAQESYTKAFEIKNTFELAQAIAATWEKLGDKQQAITYLRRAIELVPQDNPVREDDIQLIEEQIRMLESGS
jgi:tetratricopeptide (TPR) repeat protein